MCRFGDTNHILIQILAESDPIKTMDMTFVSFSLILLLGINFLGEVTSYTTEDLDKTDYMNDNQDYLDYWILDIPKKARDFEGTPEMSK